MKASGLSQQRDFTLYRILNRRVAGSEGLRRPRLGDALLFQSYSPESTQPTTPFADSGRATQSWGFADTLIYVKGKPLSAGLQLTIITV